MAQAVRVLAFNQQRFREYDRGCAHWREAQRDLLTLDFEATWNVSNVGEQRALIAGVFSRIVAGPEVVTFHVHGQPFPIQAEWSTVVKVAGPRANR